MYQCAEICLPRRKKVRETFHSNTYRIFDERIPERLEPDEVYKNHSYAVRDPKEYEQRKTHNIPQTHHAKFIRTNVRFLNAPVTHMGTKQTMADQSVWWPKSVGSGVRVNAQHSIDSKKQKDYQVIQQTLIPVRHEMNHNRKAASGIIPTLHPLGSPKMLLENMSFIHQYDCRRTPDQPYRRGHGAFVWREVNPRAFLSNGGSRPPAEEGGRGETSSPQQSTLCPQQNGNGSRAVSGRGSPKVKGPTVSGLSQGGSSQLVHSLNTPSPPREEYVVQGGVLGISMASAAVAEGRGSVHVNSKETHIS